MSAHARLSPSNHRWPHCPGSVREEARFPDVSGDAAIDGTGSHLLLEMCLDHNVMPEQYLEQQIGVGHEDKPTGWTVYSDRIDRVNMCLSYIDRRRLELSAQFPGAKVNVEAESHANPGGMFGRQDWHGTVDITISVLNPEGGLHFLEVIDYKDGRGWVSEVDNSQLLSYLGGKLRPYVGSGPDLVRPFRTDRVGGCRVTIVQPKTMPPIRYQDISSERAMLCLEDLSRAAFATDAPDAPLVAGDHCTWCKANPKRGGDCMQAVQEVSSEFEILRTLDLKTMEPDRLAEMFDAKSTIMDVFDAIEGELQARLESGDSVPGYALKPGRGTRVWNEDEDEIVKKLKAKRMKQDDIYPKKLASPAQILGSASLTDVQKRKLEEELVCYKVGKMKVTKVKDKPVISFL